MNNGRHLEVTLQRSTDPGERLTYQHKNNINNKNWQVKILKKYILTTRKQCVPLKFIKEDLTLNIKIGLLSQIVPCYQIGGNLTRKPYVKFFKKGSEFRVCKKRFSKYLNMKCKFSY